MRVLMLSKALVVGIYQRKLEDIARHGVELLALTPDSWRDERGVTPLERVYTAGYRLETVPIYRNGDFHLHYYGGLREKVRAFRPHVVHIDEEPYNLSAWQLHRLARAAGARTVFFTWQNILRRYPPPFAWGERWMLRTVDHVIAGTESAAAVWRAKGCTGRISVIPQFGTDPTLFQPATRPPRPYTIGYFGRLVEEKGVALLLDAAAQLEGEWRLIILGGGPLRTTLEARAQALGIAARVSFRAQVPSVAMPQQYHTVDVLVLPSHTRPNWKEQFGRVLVEAMASGVPVIGSSSGAIPDVIRDAGLIFPEGNVTALREALCRLRDDPAHVATLAAKGRARVEAQFASQRVADATVQVYELMMRNTP